MNIDSAIISSEATLATRFSFRFVISRIAVALVCLGGVDAATCSGQINRVAPTPNRQSNQKSKRETGSASVLVGQVFLSQLFLDDDGGQWSDSEREQTERKLDRAMRFIERHAALHGQNLRIQRGSAIQVRFQGTIPLDPHAPPEWTEKAIRQACGRSANDEVARLRTRHACDQVAFCLHVKGSALSFNLAYYQEVQKDFEAERAVCFRRYPDGRSTTAATYAHEILHLFGAGDLYFPYDHDDHRKQTAARAFPDDIMFRVDYNLDQLLIGPFTAYRVGWLPELDRRWRDLEDENHVQPGTQP